MSLNAVWPGVCVEEVGQMSLLEQEGSWLCSLAVSPSQSRPKREVEPKTDLQSESVVIENERLCPGCPLCLGSLSLDIGVLFTLSEK